MVVLLRLLLQYLSCCWASKLRIVGHLLFFDFQFLHSFAQFINCAWALGFIVNVGVN
ncbi:uncharacterized protein ASCRUDRAFT_76306 [Ascoidea rubescens DSM 1968]|uniref:Uncharacterized protein n=1 Tax=Ascoidea rubescens DSM 1968 TaxID=1344418 RepID=A0A1D2VF21_9ASCO|nr:hypothetical protein ASCRUDRAFT_76306 [Ascoidea rubescens DSM 1968]ODV60288.1 hypothetical protein ASCRUDRAFT_76306 [Ascoidea rubescens DSM 1968]